MSSGYSRAPVFFSSAATPRLVPQPDPVREPLPLFLGDEPIVAWRLWRVLIKNGKPRLAAVAKPLTWPPRQEAHAECWKEQVFIDGVTGNMQIGPTLVRNDHRAPWPDGGCDCGLWAFHDDEWPMTALWLYGSRAREQQAWAVGRVKLWGRVVELQRGFRAEYAYPVDLRIFDARWVQDRAQRDEPARPIRRDLLEYLALHLQHEYGVPAVPVLDHTLGDEATIADAAERWRSGSTAHAMVGYSFGFSVQLQNIQGQLDEAQARLERRARNNAWIINAFAVAFGIHTLFDTHGWLRAFGSVVTLLLAFAGLLCTILYRRVARTRLSSRL